MLAKISPFNDFRRMVLEADARQVLINCITHEAVIAARSEFRAAHPARHVCPECDANFPSSRDMFAHVRDKEFHQSWNEKRSLEQLRYARVGAILTGAYSRQLKSNRYGFSMMLLPMDTRARSAILAPYRPYISDPGGAVHQQHVRGMVVQGFDPKAGIRAGYRKFGLDRQFKAPGRKPDQPQFQDILLKLLHCTERKVDIVVTPQISSQVEIKFTWKDFVVGTVYIVGEFNGWRKEELRPDNNGTFCIVKSLGPGKYRYHYISDGVRVIDKTASSDEYMGELVNIIQVINPMIHSDKTVKPNATHEGSAEGTVASTSQSEAEEAAIVANMRVVNLRNVALCDDGAWSLGLFMQANKVVEELDIAYNGISDDGTGSNSHRYSYSYSYVHRCSCLL